MAAQDKQSNGGRVRIALLGAGALGRGWSKVVGAHPGAELAAVVDPLIGTPDEPAWLHELGPVALGKTLGGLDAGQLDAAVVTAQSPAHAAAINVALDRGLHVIVEKPFVTALDDAHEIVGRAAERNLTVMVSQNYRFFPGVAAIREIVADQRYGRIRSLVGQFSYDWPGKPYQHRMKHVMGLEMAVHHFDLARAFFDAEPASGWVREWNPAGSQYAGGGGLEALFELRSERDAFPFLYSGSLVGKSPNTPWGGHWRFEFDGATIIVNTIEGRYGLYRAHADGHDWLGLFADDSMHFDSSFAHFVESIRNGKQPWSSGRDNLGTLKMILGFLTDGGRVGA